MSNRNIYSDFDRSKRLSNVSNQYADRYFGQTNFIIKFIGDLLYTIFSGIAVCYRLLFLRMNIGYYTLTMVSVTVATLWVYFMLWRYEGFSVSVNSLLATGEGKEGVALYFEYFKVIAPAFVFLRGMAILWWFAPQKARYDKDYNPLSPGVFWNTLSEYEPQYWFGEERSRLFYEKWIGPIIFITIGVWMVLTAKYGESAYSDIYSKLGAFLTVSALGAFIEGRRFKWQLVRERITQAANRTWPRLMAAEFRDADEEYLFSDEPITYVRKD